MSATTIVKVFPSALPGMPLETHYWQGTLHGWMAANVPGYRMDADHPVIARIGGRLLEPSEWDSPNTVGAEIHIVPVPRGPVGFFIGKIILTAIISYALNALFGKKPGSPDNRKAHDLAMADAQANVVRLNQVIPDLAGRVRRRYPDMLCQPRRYFADKRTQAIDMMLCVGWGEYAVNAERVGDTEFTEFGETITRTIFAPGADVSGHPAHRNWYNSPTVGPTLGGAGIRLTSGSAGTASAEADRYMITGNSIVVPPGAGAMPQDWEIGGIVSISALTRSITVIDGGGTPYSPNRDVIRCDLTGLALSVGDVITLDGAGSNDGRYKVVTVVPGVVEAGTPSAVVGVRPAVLDFDVQPITFYIAGQAVLLDADYADHDALVAAINGQVGGVTVTHAAGLVRITDNSPFDGQLVTLTGYYEPVFGANPDFIAGLASASWDELTLDRWTVVSNTDTGETASEGWSLAGSLQAGEFSGVDIQRPRYKAVSVGSLADVYEYLPTEYRITGVVSGALPDGSTGVIGFEFQRLLPDGSDDAGWSGFFPETTTSAVEIRIAQSIVGGWSGWFALTPGNETATRLEYDMFFPGGLIRYNREGKVRSLKTTVEVQYRIDGGAPISAVHLFREATPDQIGFTFGIDLPIPGAHVQMRARRIGAEVEDSAYSDRVEWYGARALLSPATSYPGATTMALTITGSDVMSAQSQTQISLDVTRKLGGVETRSIADYARYVLSSVGYPVERIDTDEFDRLKAIWDGRGDWFDFAHVEQLNARDVLNRILAAGFAEVTVHHGIVMPVRDEPRTGPAHSYSAQNMLPGSFKRAWSGIRDTDHDGVDVTYLDAVGNSEEVVECRLPGDAGLRALKITAEGVTDRVRAWRIGMRQRLDLRWRRWTYEWETEMDAFNSHYMALESVIPDIPSYGRSAIVIAWSAVGDNLVLQVSEDFVFVGPDTDYVISWRLPTGLRTPAYAASPGAHAREVIAIGVPAGQRPVLRNGMEPPHVYFGTTARWEWPVLVTGVAADGLYKARVRGKNYDVRVYAHDDDFPE